MLERFYMGMFFVAFFVAIIFIYHQSPVIKPQLYPATFAGVSLKIEIATTTLVREKGLGGRADVPENYAMLFAFQQDGRYGFWMKDMLVPIDIFWLDDSAGGGSASGGKGQLVVV